MTAPQRGPDARRTLLVGLALAVAALVLFAWLADRVEDRETIWFDASVRAFLHSHASPGLTGFMRFMSAIGEPSVLLVLCITAVGVLLAAPWPRAARLFIVTMLGGFVLDGALKLLFHRIRPDPFFGTPLPRSYSFPSGHALFSVCFWGVLAALAAARIHSLGARIAIWASAAFIAASIGLSRIYLGVHYPSDVLAGYAAAIVWVAAVAWADHLLQRRRERSGSPRV